MRIKRYAGQGAPTHQGILVVDALHDVTMPDNAFTLESGSDGYRSTTGSIARGAYEYYLEKGGLDPNTDSNWYLRSSLDSTPIPEPTPDPNPDPNPNPNPSPPPQLKPDPDMPAKRPIYRPEVGALFGTRDMAMSMQRHRWQDRHYASFNNGSSAWARYENENNRYEGGFHDKRKERVNIFQFGSDLYIKQFDNGSQLKVGAMGLVGDGQVKVAGPRASAKGTVQGYNLGAYATWQEQPQSMEGTYIDTWLMQGWFTNKLKGDGLPSEKYRSRSLATSVELGYGIRLADKPDYRLYLQPQLQVIGTFYRSKDWQESTGTLITQQKENAVNFRAGMRLMGQITGDNENLYEPYLEANYWRTPSHTSMSFDQMHVQDQTTRNVTELAVGLQAKTSENLMVGARYGYKIGDQSLRENAIMLNMQYRW